MNSPTSALESESQSNLIYVLRAYKLEIWSPYTEHEEITRNYQNLRKILSMKAKIKPNPTSPTHKKNNIRGLLQAKKTYPYVLKKEMHP